MGGDTGHHRDPASHDTVSDGHTVSSPTDRHRVVLLDSNLCLEAGLCLPRPQFDEIITAANEHERT